MQNYLQTTNPFTASKISKSGFRENKTARRAALVVISRANRRIRQIESARMSNSTVVPNRKFCIAKVFNVDRKERDNQDMIRGLPSIMRPEILMTLQEEDKELFENNIQKLQLSLNNKEDGELIDYDAKKGDKKDA